MSRRLVVLGIPGLALLILPWAPYLTKRISQAELLALREVNVGTVRTSAGSTVDIHIMIGDVFRPRQTHRDLGFDLVAVSYYFDPIRFDNREVLIGNPLLFSALQFSARDTVEFRHFAANLIEAAFQGREGVNCFVRSREYRACEGDQLVPYFWPATAAADEEGPTGVRYFAALPLFNPQLAFVAGRDEEFRRRLRANAVVAVERMLASASGQVRPPPRSVAFAALGSTSHTGGDSRAFMTFREGFAALLDALKDARPNSELDRAFFVAYDAHSGVFFEEAVDGLVGIGERMALAEITSGPTSTLLAGSIGFLLLLFSLAAYQNVGQIVRSKNRWHLIGTIVTTVTLLSGAVWGTTIVASELAPGRPGMVLALYSGTSAMALTTVLWLSKRLPS